jgi:hypothetical protein
MPLARIPIRPGAVVVVVAGRVAGGVAPDEDRAEIGSVPEILPHARHREVVAGRHAGHRLGLHVQQADVHRAGFARQPRAAHDRNRFPGIGNPDPAAEEQFRFTRAADGEQAGVLEEERALLGEEQVEPIEVDLLLVDFNLGEVRVVGHVQRQAGREAVLQIRAEIAEDGSILAARLDPARLADDVRHELQIPLHGQIQSRERPGARDPEQVELERQRSPVGDLLPTADVALEVQAPGPFRPGGVAQGPEGDAELRAPALLGGAGTHFPGPIPIEVEAAARTGLLAARLCGPPRGAARPRTRILPLVRELPVVFERRGVGPEHEPVLPIVVGIQGDAEAVGVVER